MGPPLLVIVFFDRGTSVEVFTSTEVYTSTELTPRSRYLLTLGRGLVKPSTEVRFLVFAEMHLPKSVTQVRGFTHTLDGYIEY